MKFQSFIAFLLELDIKKSILPAETLVNTENIHATKPIYIKESNDESVDLVLLFASLP